MMNNLTFKINNSIIDYYDDNSFPLVLNNSIIDYKNVDKRTGEFSYTIIIPFTRKNKLIFDNIDELDKKNKFNQIYPYSFTLELNNSLISKGTFKLNAISEKGYEGIIFSKSISWYSLLAGLRLRDINLDNYEFNNTIQEFEDRWELTSDDSQYQYPYICYSNFYNTTEGGNFQYGNLKISDVNTFRNLPPAVYEVQLLKAIFNQVGLNVTGDIFEDETFKTSFIPKVGLNEAFWNWRDLGTSNVQNAGYSISLNCDPDIFQINSGRKDVYTYGSVIFDYYILEFRSSPPASPPNIGDTYYINGTPTGYFSGLAVIQGQLLKYLGGDVLIITNWEKIDMLYGSTLYSINDTQHTWYVNPANFRSLLPFNNTNQLPENVGNEIIGIVTGAYNIIGNYVVNSDKGQNINEVNQYDIVSININGNDVNFGTSITINGLTFNLIKTSSVFGQSVDVNDVIDDLITQIEATVLVDNLTIVDTYSGLTLTAIDSSYNINVTYSGNTDISITNYNGGQTAYKYTVPISGFYDIISQHIGTITKSNTDVGIEGYTFYTNGNLINNYNFIAVVRNFGSEGVTADELIQQCFEFINGTGGLPDSVIGYVDLPNNNNDNPSYYNSYLTNGLDVDLTEGDNLTVIHLVYVNGYFKPTVGYRDISTSTTAISGTIFQPTTQSTERVIQNYETSEYEPAYETVQLSHILPDLSVQDYVKGIINKFNLHFSYDDITNTLVFYQYDKFYKPKEFASDITGFIDDEQFKLEPIITSKNFSIEYTPDPSEAYIFYNKFERVDETIYSEGTNNIKLPFAQTFNNTFRFYDDSIITIPHFYMTKDSVIQKNFLEEYNFGFKSCRPLNYLGTDDNYYLKLNRTVTSKMPFSEFNFTYYSINQLFTQYYSLIFDNVTGKERLIIKGYLNEKTYKDLRLDIPVKYKLNYYIIDSVKGFSPIEYGKDTELVLIKID